MIIIQSLDKANKKAIIHFPDFFAAYPDVYELLELLSPSESENQIDDKSYKRDRGHNAPKDLSAYGTKILLTYIHDCPYAH